MNIFGIGGAELVLIIIIMLVVAGPQRMIRWMYILGRYVSKLQRMWAEAAAVLQKEFDAAGVDVEVPKQIPTRSDLQRQVRSAMNPVAQPLEDIKTELQQDLDNVRLSTQVNPPKRPARPAAPMPTSTESSPAPNGSGSQDFGSWSSGAPRADEGESP